MWSTTFVMVVVLRFHGVEII